MRGEDVGVWEGTIPVIIRSQSSHSIFLCKWRKRAEGAAIAK